MAKRVEPDIRTRTQVLSTVLEHGPISASSVARMMQLTPAAIRRHLDALESENAVEVRSLAGVKVGRGRPARHYVVTSSGHKRISHAYDQVAVDALHYVRDQLGQDAVEEFAQKQASELRRRLNAKMQAGATVAGRSRQLAEALDGEGFAATAVPVAVGTPLEAMQLCQGHCPIQQVAEEFPEFCEAELKEFGELLGVDVRRLSTLAGGAHVCTTHIPTSSINRPLLHDGDYRGSQTRRTTTASTTASTQDPTKEGGEG